jgi:hypothetical protein
VYAYARTASDSTAIIVLNRSREDREVELPVDDVVSSGTSLTDRMNTGADYTVRGDTLKVRVPARWGALLVTK